ncbi:hypothetical protein QBC43DRAFT_315640 [Cladorrhinum sp. PSN259]|nr:hypothetical protein QBC43DRAFT_315640 [Cladorrhinum sp. PSN259]
MKIDSLLNHDNTHDTPSAERFYRLQLQHIPSPPLLSGEEPELSRDDKITIRTLQNRLNWPPETIAQNTGHTLTRVIEACKPSPPPRPSPSPSSLPPRRRTEFYPEEICTVSSCLTSDPISRKFPWCDLRYYIGGGLDSWDKNDFVKAMRKAGFTRRSIKPTEIRGDSSRNSEELKKVVAKYAAKRKNGAVQMTFHRDELRQMGLNEVAPRRGGAVWVIMHESEDWDDVWF